MRIWTLHHVIAVCQDCVEVVADAHGPDGDVDGVLRAARRHSREHKHYVQVERGQHAYYHGAAEPSEVEAAVSG